MEDAKPNRYGRRKLGDKLYEEQAAKKTSSGRGSTVYGERKGGGGHTAAPQVTPDASPRPPEENPFIANEKGDRVTIAELQKILEERPELLDLAIETECQLADPRQGAIRELRKLEGARPEGPRAAVMKLLSQFG